MRGVPPSRWIRYCRSLSRCRMPRPPTRFDIAMPSCSITRSARVGPRLGMLMSSSRTRSVDSGALCSPSQAASATSRARRSRDAIDAFTAARAAAGGDGGTGGGDPVDVGGPSDALHVATPRSLGRSLRPSSPGSGFENAPRDGATSYAGRRQRRKIEGTSPIAAPCAPNPGARIGGPQRARLSSPKSAQGERRAEHHADRPERRVEHGSSAAPRRHQRPRESVGADRPLGRREPPR